MITTKDQKRIEDFYEFLDVIDNYSQTIVSSYNFKQKFITAFHDNILEMFEQFDLEDLNLIEVPTNNDRIISISNVEKELCINAINYANSNCLSKKMKYCCHLEIDYSNTQVIYNTKIETDIIIEAISQEYLKISNEEYEDYVCWTAVNKLQETADLIPLFELTGGFGVGFSYKEIENAENR